MPTVCILGAGQLGGATAHALARGERVRRVLLIDEAGTLAAGKALDIQQAGAVEGFHTRVSGTDDVTRVAGSAVVVIADENPAEAGLHRDPAEAGLHRDPAEAGLYSGLMRLKGFVADAPIVFAGASQSDLMLAMKRDGGFEPRRLIGSAPEALTAAVRAIVALEADCSPSEVALGVVGAPPSQFVVPWSEASVAGYSIERVLSQVQLRRVDARVASLWPPGPFALGLAAARVAEAIVGAGRRAANVLTVLDGEFGVRDRVAALPCLLAPHGIASMRLPQLDTRERVQLETALGL